MTRRLRQCEICAISEADEMLALNGTRLVCNDCDSKLEWEWVREDPENRRHSLDTFRPYPND
jgi:hypothetical protein